MKTIKFAKLRCYIAYTVRRQYADLNNLCGFYSIEFMHNVIMNDLVEYQL